MRRRVARPGLKPSAASDAAGHHDSETTMNVLIVHAHNEPQSFTRALCDQACETLAGQGHAVQVSDLYAMNWNPVASAADFAERVDPDYLVYALEQREGVKRQSLAADIQAELDKLLWADLLILNFPIYWFSVPAILKGWFDRVLVSGVCYGGKRFYDQGGLAGKKALVSLTLGGRQHMFGEGAIHGPLEDMLRPILRGTLAYVGMQVLEPFVAWHVPYISEEARGNFLRAYRARLENLEQDVPLRFPRLEQFDALLQPLAR
ncbi:NAD(P)H quinone oxidoreductase [Pseudomonas aeruginosa MH38]|nr:NAD(P)H quinone oxidoreductase [Pseudomonas aeruginosa MH38]